MEEEALIKLSYNDNPTSILFLIQPWIENSWNWS